MRNSRILQLLGLIITSALPSAESLSGQHVCTRMENHTVTIRESYTEPVIVQTFTWCLQVPPRCSRTRTENRERFRIKTIVEERKISECCEGYVLQEFHGDAEADTKCIPFCKSCKNGLCLRPNICQCEPGYQGNSCAHACPAGSWGRDCMQECDCASGGSCNTVSGICECPAGRQGPGCEEPCAIGRWGFRCESICECGDEHVLCDPETGDCREGQNGNLEDALSLNLTKSDLFRAVQVSGLVAGTSASSSSAPKTTNEGAETTVSYVDDPWAPEFGDFGVTRISRTTEHARDEEVQTTSSEAPDDFYAVKPEFPLPDLTGSPSTTISDELNQFNDIIPQTAREPGSSITPRISGELFYGNEDNEAESDNELQETVGPPHRSYVKTVQKVIFLSAEQVPHNPYDTTVLIVVGSVVSLCITTLAGLMVFYLRSKVFESIPLAIYSNDKGEGGTEKGNTMRSLNITNTTLPPLPTFVNPVFAANPENALITFDASELNKHYDNRTGTISIRVSGNIRDLLESHYDRPPAATCRHTMEQNAEHVYDEIPLTAPLCVRKDA